MDSLDYIVNKVLDVIRKDTKKKTSSYDAVGTVTRVEDNVAWVHFDNGVSETPVAMSINCSKGDKVHVRVAGGNAFLVGNETAPPSDNTEALIAKAVAKLADSKAESAETTAADAQETAEKAANTAGTSLVTDTMHYLATNLSSGVTTSTAGWTTTVQTIDATNKYLWTYHTYTKANDVSTDTTPVLTGRYGEDGTSVSILGSYSTYADLVAAHPTGNTGEAYMVGNDLYVWNGTAWEDVGQIKGDTGVGVASIAKTGTSGLVDTYTITYTDNSTSTYTVTNGQKGDTGAAGANGKTPYIQSGYWYIDGTSTGVKAEGDDGNTPYIQNGYWYINGTSTGIVAQGTNGVSVTAVQPQYYNHTSPTATQQEIDLWQWTTTLTYESGKYIWTRDLVTYSNSTTTASQAIYNEALTTACADAIQALATAQNVEQHFWNETSGTDAGAHITEYPQDEWTDSAHTNYHKGANLLLLSNTIKLRNALNTLAELASTGLKIYEPNDSTNPVAQFISSGAVIGKETNFNTKVTPSGMSFRNGTSAVGYVTAVGGSSTGLSIRTNGSNSADISLLENNGASLIECSAGSAFLQLNGNTGQLGVGTAGFYVVGGDPLFNVQTYTSDSKNVSANASSEFTKTFTMPSPYKYVIGVRRVETNNNSNVTVSSFDVSGDGATGNTVTLSAVVFNKSSSQRSTTVTWEVTLTI